ncbi:hypothetical protein AVEN_103217-1 [Araneus ventricosus]|uniref:Uncharacterized protein n=1 Tax=Araneus ventricosus TaxID=182803 RepID=A0A4Y2FC07_ARAVE|nr:hypothetical protein AVEN_103217-1 [Araneus ventricosus]
MPNLTRLFRCVSELLFSYIHGKTLVISPKIVFTDSRRYKYWPENKTVEYFTGAPLAIITARMRLDMDSTRCWSSFKSGEYQLLGKQCLRTSKLNSTGDYYQKCRSNISQTFTVGFRTGLARRNDGTQSHILRNTIKQLLCSGWWHYDR